MADLYPLLMSPAFDPRPWGGTDLSPIYPNHRFDENIGESWLTGDNCTVANGPLRGKTLAELSSSYGTALVGDAARESHRFPLLTKFLFPHDKLSVQVHPDDAAAQREGEPWGKTECWYVAHAKPGAQVALGLKPGVTCDQFAEATNTQKAEELLNWINVYPGEMIYVAGGTVHTMGAGSVLVETQQQSDTTYRLYDYGRPRELHLKLGLAAIKERVASGKVIRPAPIAVNGGANKRSQLIAAPYFVGDKFEIREPLSQELKDESGKTSAHVLIGLEGCGIVEVKGSEPVTLARGDAVVVPAMMNEYTVRPQWTAEFLRVAVPGKKLPEPETRL